MVSDLRINISGLSGGVHQYSLRCSSGDLKLDERFPGEVVVSARLDKTAHEITLHATVTTTGQFTCDRCLDQFQRPIEAEYTVLYVLNGGGSRGDESDETFDVQNLSPDENIIDLGNDVREYVLLAVPIKLLCREDCKGLCPTCGANLNRKQCDCEEASIDPRWAPLQKLSKN